MHADFSLIHDDKFKLLLMKQANGYIRIDKQVHSAGPQQPKQASASSLYMQVYASAVKSGERYVDEVSVLQYDMVSQSVKLLGAKCEAMSLFGTSGEEKGDEARITEKKVAGVKSTFKIEINDDERKIRDSQQTTVYHTGSKTALIELDEEDRKEIERNRLADVDEEEDNGADEDDDEDIEDDPDDDLNF